MMIGILAGVTWALETVVVGIALGTAPLNISARVVFLAPFIATFLHDTLSALYMFIYNALCGRLKVIYHNSYGTVVNRRRVQILSTG